MATLKGNAGFKWTPPGGTEQTHKIRWPLVLESKGRVKARTWNAFGRNPTKRAVVSLGQEAWEYEAVVRFDDSPADLLDVLEDSADGVELKYFPDVNDTDFFSTWLVDAGKPPKIEWEEERGTSEYRVRVTLRAQSDNFGIILSGDAHS